MSYHDDMKNTPPNLNINLGNTETSQSRRKAYEKAAAKEGARSLGDWVKKHLDKIAGYKHPTK